MTIIHEKPIILDGRELNIVHDEDGVALMFDDDDYFLSKEETEELYNQLKKVIKRWQREDRNF